MSLRFGILAYSQPENLRVLGQTLIRLDEAPLVHLDRKADLGAYKAASGDGFEFIEPRQEVFWGGFSMVDATMALVRRSLADPATSRFVLLSDDTLPIKSASEITQYFSRPDTIFVNGAPIAEGHPFYRRIENVYVPDSRIGTLRGGIAADRFINAGSKAYLLEALDALEVKKERPPFVYFKGPQWISLSRKECETVLHVYDSDMRFNTWFRYSSIPDESYVHTILLGDPRYRDSAKRQVMLSDFSAPPPKPRVWRTLDEVSRLRGAKLPFARKFSVESREIVDAVLQLAAG